jgi:hypothetical protein
VICELIGSGEASTPILDFLRTRAPPAKLI